MIQLFEWMSNLTNTQAIAYGVFVCLIMLLIPYLSIFIKIGKKIVLWQKLKVSHFGYTNSPLTINKNSNKNVVDLTYEIPEFIIEGSKIRLHWEVEGALWVKISPSIGKVKGNVAELILFRNNRSFTLEARGIFSKKQLYLEIPLEKIKVLNVSEISDFQLTTRINHIKTVDFSNAVSLVKSFTKTITTTFLSNHFDKFTTIRFNYQSPNDVIETKNKLNSRLESRTITKQYAFSSEKYNAINNLKPIKSSKV